MWWVLRAGKNGKYVDDFINNERIYICWDGYNKNLNLCDSHEDFVELAKNEDDNDTKVAIRNRASQLEYFCLEMQVGDYVLIPKARSKRFLLAKVIGDYEYLDKNNIFVHSRKIEIMIKDIDSDIFPQNIKYSLGAYRNLFHVGKEEVVKRILKEHYQ